MWNLREKRPATNKFDPCIGSEVDNFFLFSTDVRIVHEYGIT